MPDPSRPAPRRVVVIGLGGTIAMSATAGGGVVPALSAADLLAAVPGLAETGVAVRVREFRRVPSASLTFDDIHGLARLVAAELADGADGVVVTQGTDTMEETAHLLDLHHAGPEPVVVTGAMRNPTLAGADGPANLLAAVRTAADPATRDLGVLVVFADEVHAAARVAKAHTTTGNAFVSPNGGPLGYLVEGRPVVVNRPTVRITRPPLTPPRAVEVGLVTVVLGDTGALARAAAAGSDGLVVASFGAGHVPAGMVDALAEAAASIPVVLASRTGAGSVLTGTYAYPGSESDLLGRGLIPAGLLGALKARVLLHHLLATGYHDDVRRTFAEAGG